MNLQIIAFLLKTRLQKLKQNVHNYLTEGLEDPEVLEWAWYIQYFYYLTCNCVIFRYKPIDLKYIVGPVREEFETLFRGYFSVQKNNTFLEHIAVSAYIAYQQLM